MARPRFHALPDSQQNAILEAALEEFTAHGFARSSLNRIIESAGISKGAMYYYFDSKEDLYGHVIQQSLTQLIADCGPFPIPAVADPGTFWSTVEDYCRRLVHGLDAAPRLAGLLRDWLSGTGAPAMAQAQREAEQATLPWFAELLRAGQAAGAVRTDVPAELLLAVITALGQVIDLWVITGPAEPLGHDAAVHLIVDMARRAVAP